MNKVLFHKNTALKKSGTGASLASFSPAEASKVRNFHKSFGEYTITPLTALPSLAKSMGVGGIYVKDESKRFGLNAFKVLGGSYAIGCLLSEKLGLPIEELSSEVLCSEKVRKELGQITFATATDGNHGRGVAWTAQQLGQKATENSECLAVWAESRDRFLGIRSPDAPAVPHQKEGQ